MASSDAKRPVAPCLTSTGVLGMDRTIAVPVGSQSWSWLTVIPGHIVTTVGRTLGSNDSRVGASCFETVGTSAGRVQMKRMGDVVLSWVEVRCDLLASCQMRLSRLLSVTRSWGYRDCSSWTCSARRAVTAMLHFRAQGLVEERMPLMMACAKWPPPTKVRWMGACVEIVMVDGLRCGVQLVLLQVVSGVLCLYRDIWYGQSLFASYIEPIGCLYVHYAGYCFLPAAWLVGIPSCKER